MNSFEFGLGVCTSSNEDSVLSLLLLLWFLLASGCGTGIAATYRVDTVPWRIVFYFTVIVLEFGVEFGSLGHWSWRQRLHVEKCISGLSLLEHLHSRVDGRHR